MAASKKTSTAKETPVVAEPTKALAVISPDTAILKDEAGRDYFEISYDVSPAGDLRQDKSPLQLAVVKLLQGLSKEVTEGDVQGVAPGKFYNTDTLEIMTELTFVPVMAFDERYLNADPTAVSSPQICTSRDGAGLYGRCSLEVAADKHIPLIGITEPSTGVPLQVGNCSMCSHALFGRDPVTGAATRPRCRHVTWLICVPRDIIEFTPEYCTQLAEGDEDATDALVLGMFMYPFGGKARKVFDKQIYPLTRKARATYSHAWKLTAKSTPGAKGNYFIPVVSPVEIFDKSQRVLLHSLSMFAQKLRPVLTAALQAKLIVAEVDDANESDNDVTIN